MITVKQLQILSAVIRLGSVTAAARELNVSQPTASKAIQRLEDVARTSLFERMEGRLMPTPEALILAREANHLIDEWGTYERLITHISRRSGDRLRIAASPTYAASIIPRTLHEMAKAHPDLYIQCNIVTTPVLVDAAASGKVDVGIVHYTDAEPMAKSIPVCRGPIVCIMPADHPLAEKKVIKPADLHAWPLVGYRRDLPFARMIGERLGHDGIMPNVAVEANFTSVIRDMVRLGAGVALVDLFCLLFDPPDDLAIRPIEPAIDVTMAVIHARNLPLSHAAKAFVDCLKSLLPKNKVPGGEIEILDAA